MNRITPDDFLKYASQQPLLRDNEQIRKILESRNENVVNFCKYVMPYICDKKSGDMDVDEALNKFAIYANGIEVRKSYKKLKEMKMDKKLFESVYNLLKKPIDELEVEGGVGVQIAWFVYEAYVKREWNIKRYEKIYKDDSYIKWFDRAVKHPDIDNGIFMAREYDFVNINNRVKTLINIAYKI